MTSYKLKRGDLQRPLAFTLTAADGTPVDLTAAPPVKFSMRPAGSDTNTITNRAATITNPAGGVVEVDLNVPDTNISGLYLAELLVEWVASEPQTFPSDGYIEIYIGDDLAETPARTAARLRLELAASTGKDPVLDAAEVAGILDRARRADPDGRAPGDAGWVETYDVLDASIEAWEAKAAAAACRTDVTRGSLKVTRSQTVQACLRMADVLRRRRTGSAVMVAPNGRTPEGTLIANGPTDLVDGTAGAAGTVRDEWGEA